MTGALTPAAAVRSRLIAPLSEGGARGIADSTAEATEALIAITEVSLGIYALPRQTVISGRRH